jgi:hypothetical protein
MEQTVRALRAKGLAIEDDWLRRMGPAHFAHTSFRGVFRFSLDRHRDALIEPAARPRGRSAE